jgi:hypothetical protein
MGIGTLRRYHRKPEAAPAEPSPSLPELMKKPRFAKAFEEEVAKAEPEVQKLAKKAAGK